MANYSLFSVFLFLLSISTAWTTSRNEIDEEENEYRFGVFMSNLLRTRYHQKLDPTATHGVTKFSDLTPLEIYDQFIMSEKLQHPKLPNTIFNAPILSTNDLPSQVDSRNMARLFIQRPRFILQATIF
ncbi:hypothetical protein ACOSQ4_004318 [Xanthoceras sorbifolium]